MLQFAIAIVLISLVLGIGQILLEEMRKAKPLPYEVLRLRIQAGVEVFTRDALDDGVPYRVIVRGTNGTKYYASDGWRTVSMDAVYLLDDRQYPRHEGLLFDGKPAVVCDEDRSKHVYTFAYVGTGRHLSILLRLPQSYHSESHAERPVTVIIRTLAPAEQDEVTAMEEARRREAEHGQQEELRRQALALATVARLEDNFLSSEYQQQYAAKHTAAILKTFAQQWRDDYLALLSNEPLLALVQADYPLVLEVFEARFQVLKLAQRLAVEPTTPASAAKLTPEEWAARIERYRQRSLTRKRVKFEDHRADVLQDLDMLQEFVDDLGQYPLDDDERERLIQEFKDRLLGGEEEGNNGFKQL